ncbi:hypothetical protein D3C72_1210870 [compost metagenome]
MQGGGEHHGPGQFDVDAPLTIRPAHADRHEGLQQCAIRAPARDYLPLGEPAVEIRRQPLLRQGIPKGDLEPFDPGHPPLVTEQQHLALPVIERLVHLLHQALQGGQRDVDPDHAEQIALLQQGGRHRGHQHLPGAHLVHIGIEQTESLAANAAAVPVILQAAVPGRLVVGQQRLVHHLQGHLAIDSGPVTGEAPLVVGPERGRALIVVVFTIELVGFEYRIDPEQIGRRLRRVLQLLVHGIAQRLGVNEVVRRVLALEQDALRQQGGPEIGLVEVAGHSGRLGGPHGLHPVFCRVLPLQGGGGEHLLLHTGRIEEGRGDQCGGTGQQATTGNQGDPSLNRKRTHATIS